MAYFLSVFTGDAASLARTALADTPISDHANFCLHGALLALLRAYLLPHDGKELRLACAQFVFPASFARGWTELVRLYDLQCAIVELTAADAHYVKRLDRLDPPSWGRNLQIMEDVVDDSPSQTWIVSVLYSTAAQNVTTRAAMKSLLTQWIRQPEAAWGGPRWLKRTSMASTVCFSCLRQSANMSLAGIPLRTLSLSTGRGSMHRNISRIHTHSVRVLGTLRVRATVAARDAHDHERVHGAHGVLGRHVHVERSVAQVDRGLAAVDHQHAHRDKHRVFCQENEVCVWHPQQCACVVPVDHALLLLGHAHVV
jgi:hypothetical protein